MNDSFNTDQADEGGQILSGLKAIQEMTEQVQEGTAP